MLFPLVVQRITDNLWSVRINIFGSVRTWSADWFMKKKKLCTCSVHSQRGHGQQRNEGNWTPRVIYVPCMGKRGSWITAWRGVGTVVEGCIGIGSRRGRCELFCGRERAAKNPTAGSGCSLATGCQWMMWKGSSKKVFTAQRQSKSDIWRSFSIVHESLY